MSAVPCPTSRAYNSAPPTGMRLSRGVALRSLSSADDEPSDNHAADAQARTAKTSVAFMALKLYQPVTLRNPVPTATCLPASGRQLLPWDYFTFARDTDMMDDSRKKDRM